MSDIVLLRTKWSARKRLPAYVWRLSILIDLNAEAWVPSKGLVIRNRGYLYVGLTMRDMECVLLDPIMVGNAQENADNYVLVTDDIYSKTPRDPPMMEWEIIEDPVIKVLLSL